MKYKITSIDTKSKVVALTVTFDDNSTYNKRMMADVSSEETIHAGIQQWLSDYVDAKSKETTFDSRLMVNTTTDIKVVDLPKTSHLKAQEEEAVKAAQRVRDGG